MLLSADMVARAAHLGEMGDVDGAMECTKQADILGQQHATLHKQLTEPERTMTVCDICGVFINSTDNEQRRLVSGLALAGTAFELSSGIGLHGKWLAVSRQGGHVALLQRTSRCSTTV